MTQTICRPSRATRTTSLICFMVLAGAWNLAAGQSGEYTLEQVAEHDTLDSCWMAIEGQVYDVTRQIPIHPTTPDVLEPWCGREATEGMRTRGQDEDHSPAAWAMLQIYRIGRLAEQ
ncbi:cytochrome b5-like heme/steroid binding domain-containing protein [Thioalkalicoccus limnaeus]|uniref:Cytochrome b5-like heme/steroid binding domain-containing protein n=1 Tax=Thioalkalicoccus limnaeus TaxID=120681 RepID=A0ABV4BCE7_9GAMM